MSKGRPWKTREVDGFEVLIGRDSAGNVELTRSLEPEDVWLHVDGGAAGSHVVIRGGEHAGADVVEQAARWAAWHSSVRHDKWAAVMVCEADRVLGVADDGTASVEWPARRVTVTPEDLPAAEVRPVPQTPDRLYSAIQGALRQAIHDHGPVDTRWVPSAAKRVLAAVRAVLEGKA
jgi:hypothetical protein